jgi:hypothetical protein
MPKRHPHTEPAHWSVAFIEHMRMVHFSLVIVSAGLIIVASTTTDTQAQRALAQLEAMAMLVSNMGPNWLSQRCESVRAALSAAHAGKTSDNKLPSVSYVHSASGEDFQIVNLCWIVETELTQTGLRLQVMPISPLQARLFAFTKIVRNADSLGQLPTVADFRQFWDMINTAPQVVLPLDIDSNEYSRDPRISPRPLTPVPQPASYYQPTFDLATSADAETPVPFVFRDIRDGSYIPVTKSDFLPLDGFETLKNLIPEPARSLLRPGSFASSFPDLEEVTRGLDSAPYSVWKSALTREVKRVGSSFEAFGLQLPAQAIALWGGILVISIQTYLLTHLLEFKRRVRTDDEECDVAWVGLYAGMLSRLLVVLSVVVLPAACVSVLGIAAIRTGVGWMPWATSLSTIVISAALCLLSCKNLPRPR